MDTFDSKSLLKDFTPEIEKTTVAWWITLLVFVSIFLFGIYGLYTQITGGHIVTGMRDQVVWGIYIVNFILNSTV